MSNIEASKLYETIVEDVITDSRQDFENMGIDESTLQELRKIWCEKLSQTQVCKFSWDEEEDDDEEEEGKGEEVADSARDNAIDGGNNGLDSENQLPPVTTGDSAVSVPEPGVNNSSSTVAVNDNGTAENGSNDALSYNNNLGIELPSLPKTELQQDGELVLPQINQADGTFELVIHSNNGREMMEKLLQDKIQNSQKKKKKGENGALLRRRTFHQVDGALDDDDDADIFNDSDDINSDLDDDIDSEKSDDEDGDQEGQIMLCLYDKVQRIKNKWKLNLKEGIANIDGKDYVFHKATGECEW